MDNSPSVEAIQPASNIAQEDKIDEKNGASNTQEQKNTADAQNAALASKTTLADLSKELDRLDKIRLKDILLSLAKEDSSMIEKIHSAVKSNGTRNTR
jgi:hypothetical protein